MNFRGSRLGFWFRLNRANKSKRVLVFYDPYTDGPGGNTDWYNGGDVNPGTEVWPVIRDREIALGNQPELIVGYSQLPIDMSVYAHVWDIGYASPYITNPSYNPTNKLLSYLQNGGAMFMLGENANFGARDDTIDTFVNTAGGGTVTRSSVDYDYSVAATVEPQFLLANNNKIVYFSRPGTFILYGNGTPMSTAFSGSEYVAVCWTTGSLTNAGRGAITSVLDINFLVQGGNYQPDFIDNLILTLNRL